ncbi:MAG: DNA-binding protein [Candidatus Vogelbacteria bacterium CG10_big_fil_rev_8_21_14_0_10_51_16]|uniref:DNA-binding protein n=1 Tax=Candidatus Vogelbacteria bacterium CG10_big_fil_rev_8_21_14_0_10_51_16 TaxID=1975045 RepID=A0A2H0RFD3_9BACT|nr:MAG: DNA-binding protein [Candidatus Vogelbacteria bacterium CG10_big_fil_rev_8_21_14_0_10_51_16]
MSTTNKRLGANMRRIREEKSLLQKDFAKKVGLDAAYLSNIENGKMNVTIATLEKIAKALGVQLKELM